jgi:hypothetical protein
MKKINNIVNKKKKMSDRSFANIVKKKEKITNGLKFCKQYCNVFKEDERLKK